MRLSVSSLTAAALTLFTASASAQVHVFTVDTGASSFTWSATTSVGTLVGNPSNTFALTGTVDANLTGTAPITAAEFLSSDALVTPDIMAAVPNPIPILPPLATIDVSNLRLSVTSPSFAVAGSGNFMTDITLTSLTGTLTTTPLGGTPTPTDVSGLVSLPTPAAGTLTRALDIITLSVPVNSGFPLSVMTPLGLVTGTLSLNGTLVATTTAIDTPTFTSICNGDGGDQMGCTDCPCSNNAMPGTVGGCLNSSGSGTELIASGDTSLSLPSGSSADLRFAAQGAPPNSLCVLNSGDSVAPTNPASVCFGLDSGLAGAAFDGLRCAVANTQRHGGRPSNASGDVGTTTNPWGGESNPTDGIGVFAGFTSGQTRYFQIIHRDSPSVNCMTGLNTSQAIPITFQP